MALYSATHAGATATAAAEQANTSHDSFSARKPALKLSCLPCRRRKSKCDRQEPCSSCTLRSTEAFCYSTKELPEVSASRSRPIQERANRAQATASSSGGVGRVASPAPSSSATGSPSTSRGGGGGQGECLAMEDTRPTKVRRLQGEAFAVAGASRSRSLTNDASALDLASVRSTLASVRASLDSIEKAVPLLAAAATSSSSCAAVEANKPVAWPDLMADLPSISDCQTLFHCFFTELDWQVCSIHRGTFERIWSLVLRQQCPVPRYFVSEVFSIIALTLYLMPAAHPAARLAQTPHSHQTYAEKARALALTYVGPEDHDSSFARLQAEVLVCHYQTLLGGQDGMEISWYCVGATVRHAKALQLFDESHWRPWEMPPLQKEMWRRVAYELKSLDRWLGMLYQRCVDLDTDINVREPDYLADDRFDAASGALLLSNDFNVVTRQSAWYARTGHKQLDLLIVLHRFLRTLVRITPTERYAQAQAIDAHFIAWETEMPPILRWETARENMRSEDPHSYVLAAQSLIRHCGNKFLRCTLMRPFLLDRKAPSQLRFAALEHARAIMATMPTLVTLSTSPWVAFQASWNAQHLHVAATTFATVFLDDDATTTNWPAADLEWFAGHIFEVIDTLSVLGRKTGTARISQELLVGLCTSRDQLRERFQMHCRGVPKPVRRQTAASSDIAVPAVFRLASAGGSALLGTPSSSNGSPRFPPPPMASYAAQTAQAIPSRENAGSTGFTPSLGNASDAADAQPWPEWMSLDQVNWGELLSHLDGSSLHMEASSSALPSLM